MKVNGVTKWIMINQQAGSLFDVLAEGGVKSTALGRKTWVLLWIARFWKKTAMWKVSI